MHDHLSFDHLSGLNPTVWLSVGAGFSREEVKSMLLQQGRGFVGDAITTLQELCLKITGVDKTQVLGSVSRQEVLKMLLAEPRIAHEFVELKRIKRQRNFVRRLDMALLSGRLCSAHEEEAQVLHERLLDRLGQGIGEHSLRQELQALTRAYEAWMGAVGCWDLPLLLKATIEKFKQYGWPKDLARPQAIWHLSTETPESLERTFWEMVEQFVEVKRVQSLDDDVFYSSKVCSGVSPCVEWLKWHTLDDAAEYFVEEFLADLEDESVNESGALNGPTNGSTNQAKSWPRSWNDHVILIPDVPVIRRSLNRALKSREIPFADPRDPTRLRWDELFKRAVLPLEVVASRFERRKVISWLNSEDRAQDRVEASEIYSRGIHRGLSAYEGGSLAGLHARLVQLNEKFGGRKTCEDVAGAHLDYLRSVSVFTSEVISFFETTWNDFKNDIERIGQEHRKAPLYFWLERLQSRLAEASPPVERLKPEFGIRIYRLQQAPVFSAKKVWIFGMPPYWLSGEGLGNYYFSEREREILSTEFAVRSAIQVREERLRVLGDWIKGAESVVFLDSHYHVNGRECESILPVLKELEVYLKQNLGDAPTDRGSHPRYTKSYGVLRPVQSQEVLLPELPKDPGETGPTLSATLIEHYSRCPFLALTYHRWHLTDLREPDIDLWPEVKGKILHEAVRVLLSRKRNELTLEKALEQAWHRYRPKGLIRNPRVEQYVKSRMIAILETFLEKEAEYIERAAVHHVVLDDQQLRIHYPEFSIIGKPDRIDEHHDGYFIIDFKSGGTSPHGTDMIERGYRLQLPFYALAVQKNMGRPVLGVQFVELNRKGSRRSGIFFKEYNGKEPGKLTNVVSRSKSLINRPIQEVWSELEEKVLHTAQQFMSGNFPAHPNVSYRDRECGRCRVADLCGRRRYVKMNQEGEGDEEGEG